MIDYSLNEKFIAKYIEVFESSREIAEMILEDENLHEESDIDFIINSLMKLNGM